MLHAADPDALHAAVWGSEPDWSQLAGYAHVMTADEVRTLLDTVYAPGGAADAWLTVADDFLQVQTGRGDEAITIALASSADDDRPAPRYWRTLEEWRQTREGARPLEGLRVVLDPGHIGGEWGRMEGREWRLGDGPLMREGDLVLLVAQEIQVELRELGAQVTLVRARNRPVTPYRPADFVPLARADLEARGQPVTPQKAARRAELFFYRYAEIRARAELINQRIRPDLVIALHLNAAAWPDPAAPALVEQNHAHILLHGTYGAGEMERSLGRFEMLRKLLTDTIGQELAWGEGIAESLEAETSLPTFSYSGTYATKVGSHPYLWARNLLANRIYDCPVVYLEPFVLNSTAAYALVGEGPEEMQRSSRLVQEYAQGVVKGMLKAAQSPER